MMTILMLLFAFGGDGGGRSGRLAPPSVIPCDRNDLTSYTGVVTRYQRLRDKTVVRIRTDEETTEEVTVKHRGTSDPSKSFLIEGERFRTADWKRIESRPKVLRPGMRATAWVCTGEKPAVIVDWRP